MTTVSINRSGTDQATLDIFQVGSHESSVFLKHDLLDSTLNYHFAVTSLSVPLNDTPIFKLRGVEELFRIERRDVGASIHEDLTLHEPGDPATPLDDIDSIYEIRPDNKMFDASTFVKDLSNWVRGFNIEWTRIGFDGGANGSGYSGNGSNLPAKNDANAFEAPYQFLGLKLTADGSVHLTGSDVFWNNFVIRWTLYGAAVLGFTEQLQEVTRVIPFATHYYTAKTQTNVVGTFTNSWFDEDPASATHGVIIDANMAVESVLAAEHPLYQSVDQRVKITVESHMPMASSVAIVDEKESVDRSIADVHFESKLENQITFDEAGFFESMSMSSAMYAGQYNFIKKSDYTFQWNKLMTAYELKLFRFQIYVWYRVWSDATNEWKLTRDKLSVPKEQFWELAVRFVSDS